MNEFNIYIFSNGIVNTTPVSFDSFEIHSSGRVILRKDNHIVAFVTADALIIKATDK